jgi:ferredoxin
MTTPLTASRERVDERDVMFARMARTPGTPAFLDYYARRPELRAPDDRLRALPALLQPGGKHYDETVCREASEYFRAIDGIVPDAEAVDRWAAALREGGDLATVVRRELRRQGALDSGVAPLDQRFVYTHKGRFDADYGVPVNLPHPSAVVFLVEMARGQMRDAPGAPAIRESARQYWRAAVLALTLEAGLRAAGFEAKAHYDARYDVILPPLAVAAGLGEMGRHNMLVADRAGSRVRIGAVTTDAPLTRGRPRSLGVESFCRLCKKCADNCPSHALSDGDRVERRGVMIWPTAIERCYGYWRAVGTDCGICMAVCPFSQPDTPLHRFVRAALARAPRLARLALWFDDRLYGRTWNARRRKALRG